MRPLARLTIAALLAATLSLAAVTPAGAALTGFGSNGLSYNAGATDLAKKQVGYDRLTGAGMNRVRVEFSWAMIQRAGAKSYDWSTVDGYFAAMPAGVKAIAGFNNSPAWARDSTQKTVCGTADPAVCRMPPAETQLSAWQTFVKTALARYGSKIAAVEAWNEPNLVNFWRPRIDAARWARLMHATATAARAARPGITVISGGLVGGTNNDPTHDVGPIPFLQAAFAAVPKLAADIDQYGLHPYSRDACGSFGADSWAVQRDFISDACASAGWDMERMRWVIKNYDAGSKVAVTEFGYHTGGGYAIDQTAQRDWLVRAYDWFNTQPDVELLIFHTLFDTSWAPSADEATYGMVDTANQPKPAWTAFHAKLVTGA